MDEPQAQIARNRLKSWERLKNGFTKLQNKPLTDSQREALRQARFAVAHLCQNATSRPESWESLENGFIKLQNEPLTDGQTEALQQARFAMWHLRYQEVAMDDGRASAAVPGAEAALDPGHRGCALPLNEKQKDVLRLRFLPLLVLFKSLNSIRGRADQRVAESAPPSHHQTLEEKFCLFVNKISYICDYELNGKSFTACVVLQKFDGVQYLLASNSRNTQELEDMRTKLMAILTILKENITASTTSRESDGDLSDRLLRLVLANHKRRVNGNVDALFEALMDCAEACKRMTDTEKRQGILTALNRLIKATPKNRGVSRELEETVSEISLSITPSVADVDYIDTVVRLIRTIQDLKNSPAMQYMWQLAAADMQHNTACWSSMQHAAGRLVSYLYAVQTLIIAHHIWAAENDLFLNFDIKCLPSSSHHPGLPPKAETADTIIGRVAPRQKVQGYREHAREAQKFRLDDVIATQWASKIRPYVHAELLLLDWLQNTRGGTKSFRFFNGWQYIGASKPTCRLCKYYLDEVAPEVKVRGTHNNVYYNWRLPDVYQDAGESTAARELSSEQLKKWRDVINSIKARVLTDTGG